MPLEEALEVVAGREAEVVALDEALARLADVDPQLGRVVEMRYFGGLTVGEVAEVLGVSRATVERAWVTARVWLKKELTGGDAR